MDKKYAEMANVPPSVVMLSDSDMTESHTSERRDDHDVMPACHNVNACIPTNTISLPVCTVLSSGTMTVISPTELANLWPSMPTDGLSGSLIPESATPYVALQSPISVVGKVTKRTTPYILLQNFGNGTQDATLQMVLLNSDSLVTNLTADPLHHIVSHTSDYAGGNVTQNQRPTDNQISKSWGDVRAKPVLQITCKNIKGELHKTKFGSGINGKCIQSTESESVWYTPYAFEAICGRGSSKDWKRSIKFDGRNFQSLLDKEILDLHANNCSCVTCLENTATAGPVTFAAPYKKRTPNVKKNTNRRRRRNTRNNPPAANQIPISERSWEYSSNEQLYNTDYTEVMDQFQRFISETSEQSDISAMVKKLEYDCETFAKITMKIQFHVDVLILNAIEDQTMDQDMTPPVMDDAVPAENGAHGGLIKIKCFKCNNTATTVCAICLIMPYCSSVCHKNDWQAHRIVCKKNLFPDTTQQLIRFVGDGEPK